MRRILLLLGTVFVLASCDPDPQGPRSPIAMEQVVVAPALDASAARQAVVDFVDAYAASPTEGVGALAELVVGEELGSWVRWLDVQHREFGGSIDAFADVRDVEFVASMDAGLAHRAQVGLSASVTFLFEPTDEEAFERARILDGLVLLRTERGAYKVMDLQRDGVPMSAGIELFREETRSERTVEVTLDSLFMFPPHWQFNVLVRNRSGRNPLILDPDLVGLYAEGADGLERIEPVITGSLALVPARTEAEGLLTFPLQDSPQGRVLTLAYRTGRNLLQFDFPLDALVNAVPPPPPTTAGAEQDVTT